MRNYDDELNFLITDIDTADGDQMDLQSSYNPKNPV